MTEVVLTETPLSIRQFVLSWLPNSFPGSSDQADFGLFDFAYDSTTFRTFQGVVKHGAAGTNGRVFQVPFSFALRGWALPMVNQAGPIVICFSANGDPRIEKNDFMLWLWPDGLYRVPVGTWDFSPGDGPALAGFRPPKPFYFNLQRDWLSFRAYAFSQQTSPGATPPFFEEMTGGPSAPAGNPYLSTMLLTLEGK